MNLQLSLKRKWFDMTKPDGKTEDYREINEYWLKRLFEKTEFAVTKPELIKIGLLEVINDKMKVHELYDYMGWGVKTFDKNIMTLGYPKRNDFDRIKIFYHEGIEIATGREEWGAEQNKLYFVIKHGEPCKK